jgi:hypothetical protein
MGGGVDKHNVDVCVLRDCRRDVVVVVVVVVAKVTWSK